MKNLQYPIFGTTILLMIYTLTPLLGFSWAVVFNFFLIMNVMVIWMVIRILKDGIAPQITFEEQWYEDEIKN